MEDVKKKKPQFGGLSLQIEDDKQEKQIVDQIQKLTLEQEGTTFKEEKKDDILKIIACNNDSLNYELEDFKKISHLGEGASGSVDKVIHEQTNKYYAIKKIKYVDNETVQKHLNWEVKALFTSQSNQIVKYMGAFYRDSTIHIVQEFMDKGSLDKVLAKVGQVNDIILGEIAYQIIEGLAYLHRTLKIIHRDIKPANILINSEGQVKIADLGICGKIENTLDKRKTWVGTVTYMSPERLRGEEYSNNTDVWSLGLMLLECKLGKNPLSVNGNALWDVLKGIDDFVFPELPDKTNVQLIDFMKCCLVKDPNQRQSADQLLQHKFLKKFSEKREKVQESFTKWLETV